MRLHLRATSTPPVYKWLPTAPDPGEARVIERNREKEAEAMDSDDGGGHERPSLAMPTPESLVLLREGISLVLSQWTALQMAVRNEWGGRDSGRKSEELASTLLSWFSQSRTRLYVDDLENILDENMVLSFNTTIEDGSVEEIAEQLMIMHEDCLQGNYDSIEKLKLIHVKHAVSQSRQVNHAIGERSE
ncbi:pre-rRNA-processing protein TSR2 isoform X1 [Elaeis guineensis]|uniref:Pre-rRNA-processing protein TSR2 isoform X2 n=1 Tax=Elaeis guineensis var. tenera TaxID=51953 RepID=A0A6I9QZ39_ELAGV|nr:pre-rRNA-processing protein TSR2 isoform X2 [Elaeis guineensis]